MHGIHSFEVIYLLMHFVIQIVEEDSEEEQLEVCEKPLGQVVRGLSFNCEILQGEKCLVEAGQEQCFQVVLPLVSVLI